MANSDIYWQCNTFRKVVFYFHLVPFYSELRMLSHQRSWCDQDRRHLCSTLLQLASSANQIQIPHRHPATSTGGLSGGSLNILYKYVNMWEITRFVSKMLFLSFHFYWKANEWYVTVCNFGFLRTLALDVPL